MSARVGLVKTSLVDFPGEVAATLFTAGCNIRCPYCHNPELVFGTVQDEFLGVDEALAFIRKRRAVLGGICITGGEPLLHGWIDDVIEQIRTMGLKVKLDTNGLLPDRLTGLEIDYLAVDLKVAPARYGVLGGSSDAVGPLRKTIAWARDHVADIEFRTTVVPELVTPADMESIAELLQPGERLTLARFRPGKTLDPSYARRRPPTDEEMRRLQEIAVAAGIECRVRSDPARTETSMV